MFVWSLLALQCWRQWGDPGDLLQYFLGGKGSFVSLWDKWWLGEVPYELVFWGQGEDGGHTKPRYRAPSTQYGSSNIQSYSLEYWLEGESTQKCGRQAVVFVL